MSMTGFLRHYPRERKLRIGNYLEITDEKLKIFRERFTQKYVDMRNFLTIN